MKWYVGVFSVTFAGMIAVFVLWPYSEGIGPATLVAVVGYIVSGLRD